MPWPRNNTRAELVFYQLRASHWAQHLTLIDMRGLTSEEPRASQACSSIWSYQHVEEKPAMIFFLSTSRRHPQYPELLVESQEPSITGGTQDACPPSPRQNPDVCLPTHLTGRRSAHWVGNPDASGRKDIGSDPQAAPATRDMVA
jgi:hypothetical protein